MFARSPKWLVGAATQFEPRPVRAGLCVQVAQTAWTWEHAIAPWAELIARTLWATVGKPGRPPATRLTGEHRRAGRVGEHSRPVVIPPHPPRVCKMCGVPCEKTYCASCGKAHSREEFYKGRLVAQTLESRTRRSATQKQHVLAKRAWRPSPEFRWLDRKAYAQRIRPRLVGVTISGLESRSLTLEISALASVSHIHGTGLPSRGWLASSAKGKSVTKLAWFTEQVWARTACFTKQLDARKKPQEQPVELTVKEPCVEEVV